MNPEHPQKPAHAPSGRGFQAAFAMHQQGRLREAEQAYRAVLAADPADFDCLHHLGLLHAQRGELDDAVTLMRQALAHRPHSVEAHNNLGNALALLKRHDEAIASYRNALSQRPRYAEAHNNIGNALRALGQHEEAIAHYREALAIDPNFAKAHNNLGNALEALNRPEEAIACYQRALALRPNSAVTHNNLGVALAALNRHEEAIANYTMALALNTNYAEAHNNLAAVLLSINEAERALAHCEKAVALKPALVEAHNNLANAQKALNRYERAIAGYRTAIALKPDYAQAYANMGDALRELGLAEDARQAYEKAVELAPAKAQFHRRLAENSRLRTDDPRVATMRKLAEDASLPVKDQIELHFALAKVFADLGQHEHSFRHLLKGNALHRARIDYDEAATLGLFDRIRTVFTPELLRAKSDLGDPSALPVFIVGMIRSGTTLVEQILASHPDVHGAGELTDFAKALTVPPGAGAEEFPESFAAITGDGLKRIATAYLDRIRALAPSARRIADKMPANFRLLGAIHLVLPNARIIHLRRDPVDTCLSCFSILFAGEQPHAYDLAELGRYYRAYDSLMQHWRRVLPAGVMLEISYEELTSNVELEARKIVAHCGLNWNDRCLAFHQTPRPVRTASALQVRRPIYRTSIGRWRPYENQLLPLLMVLNSAGLSE